MSIVPYSGYKATAIDVSSVDVVFTEVCRALWVGVTGNINCVTANGDTVTFTNVPVGFFPMTLKSVLHTSTTASGLVAIF